MADHFNAVLVEEAGKGVNATLKQLTLGDLPQEADVLIEVAYSTINYKDGLALTGTIPICQKLPMVGGIDLAGTVVESASPDFRAGDRVLVNGYGLSEVHWGGYSQMQRVRSEFLVKVPDAFTLQQTMFSDWLARKMVTIHILFTAPALN